MYINSLWNTASRSERVMKEELLERRQLKDKLYRVYSSQTDTRNTVELTATELYHIINSLDDVNIITNRLLKDRQNEK